MILILVYFALGFLIDTALTAAISFASALTSVHQQLKDLGLSSGEFISKILTGQASVGIGHQTITRPSRAEYILASIIQVLSFGISSLIYFQQLPKTNLATGVLLGAVWASIYAALHFISIFLNHRLEKLEAAYQAKTKSTQPAKSAQKTQSKPTSQAKPVTAEATPDTDSPDTADPAEDTNPHTIEFYDITDVILFFITPILTYILIYLL